MNFKQLLAPALLTTVGIGTLVGSFAIADTPKESKAPEMKLPEGWTAADMQACILAGTPGKNHATLAKDAGKWEGKTTMWMMPGSEPVTSDAACTITPILDGRYSKVEHHGEMPGMGPYHGLGIQGFDNVSKKFVSTWIDNHSTGIMQGEGEMSPDGKSLTWKYTYTCPITQKPAVMRQIEKTAGNKKTIEMFGAEPKSGKEYKMMVIEMTKK
jgi:hypothetical protein